MTEKTDQKKTDGNDVVTVDKDAVTVKIGEEKMVVTEEKLKKSGVQFLKAMGVTAGLILVGAIAGAVAGAALFAGAAASVAAAVTGFFAGGVLGKMAGGFVLRRTDAYKGLKKIADAEKKQPGTLKRFADAMEKKIDSASAKLQKGGAKDAFAQKANDNATDKAEAPKPVAEETAKAKPKALKK
ncbi:MAG: hypothetical protein EA357_10340 [Micavibrio sp.]|nr:MAG: hypothetical protein EA357_10340 [Micavibrio sp.]